jgi:hypothetical protein
MVDVDTVSESHGPLSLKCVGQLCELFLGTDTWSAYRNPVFPNSETQTRYNPGVTHVRAAGLHQITGGGAAWHNRTHPSEGRGGVEQGRSSWSWLRDLVRP